MPGKRDAALAWARRGYRVFPLQSNSRNPLDLAWTLHATRDEAVIRQWWTDPVTGFERDHNVGCLTTDRIVVDVDVKKGKPGLRTFAELGMDFDTLAVRTPTGGYHLYYDPIDRVVGGSPLGEGIDVRSHNGYVVAPGSTIDGAAYEVELDLPVAAFPEHLRPRLKSPRKRADAAPVSVELDAPEAVEIAAHWLLHDAPPAVAGQNGNDTTYRVACRLLELGVSEATAYDLFLDEYNPRCEPPWDADEARALVENAYRYARGQPGSASPAAVFGDVVPVEASPRAMVEPVDTEGLFRFGNAMEEAAIRSRPWVLQGFLMERVVTMLVAAGGGGKSVVSLILAAHLAVGRSFMGFEIRRPGKSIVYNAEDDLETMSGRLLMICDAYGMDRAAVVARVCLLTSDDVEIQVTENQPPQIKTAHVQMLVDAASDPEVVMLCVDPIVEIHTGRENDSGDMRYVMGVLRVIARRANVPVLAVQHTGKPANGAASQAGDQNAGRGSSAIPAAARVVITMYPATEAEALQIGVPVAERKNYVRLDGAKANFSASAAETRWLRWETHTLTNGDNVGVLVEHDAGKSLDAAARATADRLAAWMAREGQASMTLDEVAAALLDPLQPPEDRTTLKNRLARLFAAPVRSGSASVALVTDTESGKKSTRVVMR